MTSPYCCNTIHWWDALQTTAWQAYLLAMTEVRVVGFKVLQALELASVQEVQQHEQLSQVVLQRRARQQSTLPGLEVVQLLKQLALLVFQPACKANRVSLK